MAGEIQTAALILEKTSPVSSLEKITGDLMFIDMFLSS
jgi:hypothetical protein